MDSSYNYNDNNDNVILTQHLRFINNCTCANMLITQFGYLVFLKNRIKANIVKNSYVTRLYITAIVCKLHNSILFIRAIYCPKKYTEAMSKLSSQVVFVMTVFRQR